MCEKEPKRRSCTECPQYDGMKCTATDFTLGDRAEVLYQEHRRGFICLDTGEAELRGDAAIQWTAWQERLRQEKGYKSCEEMWDAEGKQVKSGFRNDEDNEHLEPMLQISNVSASTAGSPSSECPSRREGPPQKGKIDGNSGLPSALEWRSETTCLNCRNSHREGLRLVCNRWGIRNILMPQRTCIAWKFDPDISKAARDAGSPLSTTVDNVSLPPGRIVYAEGSGLQYVKNPPPLWKS